jgi:hypothetical protein
MDCGLRFTGYDLKFRVSGLRFKDYGFKLKV